jgi:hypothetical protein
LVLRLARSTVLVAGVAFGAALGVPSAAAAQAPGFMTRVDFYLLWARLAADDPRFNRQGRFNLDADVADYGSGRLVLEVDYEAFLGGERRTYDLNQGAYRFDLDLTKRTRAVEIGAFFSHSSRHEVDREMPHALSWNVFGARARREWHFADGATLTARADIGRAWERAFVDYEWISQARATLRHPLAPHMHVSLLLEGSGVLIWTDESLYGRARTCGARVEGGIRLTGRRGALEIITSYERRIDGYPLELSKVRMWSVGFRVLNR